LLEHLNREAAHLQRRFVRKFAKGATHE
jgi:hypothetical protein